MLKRALWLLPLLVIGCTGLFLENGNSYPCDFSLGPGKRDEACQAGDICGTNNVCQSFIYEGPRFEGQATLPEYGVTSGEGTLLHPLALKSAAKEVTAVLPVPKTQSSFFRTNEGIFRLQFGRLDQDPVMLPSNFPGLFGTPTSYQPFMTPPNLVQTNVIFRDDTGHLAIAQNGIDVVSDGVLPFTSAGYRVIDKGGPLQAQIVAWDSSRLGKVEPRMLGPGWVFSSVAANSGAVFDVAGISLPARQWLLALRADAIDLVELTSPDAGVDLAASLDSFAAVRGELKTDPGNRVVAAVRRGAGNEVLSTFQMNIGADGLTLSSPWPDCKPCRAGRLELVAPSVRSGAPTVDVLCRTNELHAFRVVGSVALTQFESCLTEPLEPSIELQQLVDASDGGVVSWNSQAGILLGGKSGELWNGDSLTTLQPLFLDRVPLDVAPASTGATSSVAVITDQYLAVQQTPETLLPNERINGFRRLAAADLEDSKLMGFVHGVNGWAITDQGELIGVSIDGGSPPRVVHGPQLVTANDEPIRSTIGGEGYIGDDGGLRAFFIAADDSLYFAPKPEDPEEDVLVPVLTPEPSVPIRSLALERTPLGTNGIDAARGYLVTSRNLYSWELSGDPARWSSTPLLLSAGEPVEVWFDSARSALGRVGYRDGQIFSLPGGYPLAEPLPAGQVIDFENLGGWPVAYATTGLFIAGWDQVDGKLQNRFPNGVNKPMTWREVKIAGANPTPWMHPPLGAEGGKLFVAEDPKDGGTQQYRLLIFNEHEVRQVAHHLRRASK